MAGRATDMRPAFRAIRELIISGHKRNWASQGQHLGERWPANTIGTIERKARMGQSLDPLTATGALHRAVHGGRGRYSRVSRTSVSVGVSLFYARFQLAKKGRVPRRPMVGIARTTEQAALKIVETYLVKGVSP